MTVDAPNKPDSSDRAPPLGAGGRVLLALADIKLAHSVFALPFAVLAAFVAGADEAGQIEWSRFAGQLGLVVVCMVLARTFAMLVNRLADRGIDAANDRTAGRAFASGRVGARHGAAMLAVVAAGFVAAASMFGAWYGNWWPAMLAAPVLAWIGFYSFTKRFTWLCHVFLGGALAVSPLAAAIAIRPEALAESMALWWIAGMVLCWVAGFDVIYALQDLDFDRDAGLSSVPARFGWRRAIWISRGLHGLSLAALLMAWMADHRLGAMFMTGIAGVMLVLLWEHTILARRGRAGIPMAFFTLNGLISLGLGLAGVLDVVI